MQACGQMALTPHPVFIVDSGSRRRCRGRRVPSFMLSRTYELADRTVQRHATFHWPDMYRSLLAPQSEVETYTSVGCWGRPARWALALFGSICLSLGGSTAALAANAPSVTEDKLLEVVRLLENKLDTAAQHASEVLSSFAIAPAVVQGKDDAGPERWRALVEDVWEVVDTNFMDARAAGFDRDHWRKLRDDVLSQPLASKAAAYGAIRDMVRSGLRDPYSRFISPEEFAAMLKYDVSGVGLNLGTAEEFVIKTGIPLPGYAASSTTSNQAESTANLASRDESSPSRQDAAIEGAAQGKGMSGGGELPGRGVPPDSSPMEAPGQEEVGQAKGGHSQQTGGVYVLGLIKGLAGDAAGIEQGDEVVAVGGRSMEGRTPFDVASMLAGAEEDEASLQGGKDVFGQTSSRVLLQVRKYSSGDMVDVAVERPVQEIPSPVTARLEKRGWNPSLPAILFAASNVSSSTGGSLAADQSMSSNSSNDGANGRRQMQREQQEGSVGYIKLSSFNARAQRDVAAAVRKLEAEGAARIVLDLRDNRGGLVSEGIEVAKLFLQDNSLVVRTAGKARSSSSPITAPGPALSAAPLVVLVNEHTASASEILAGALQDNCRAVLAGKQTYGKGLIQSVYELGDGSGLVLTVGKYMTPRGVDIDRGGIRPQFKSVPSTLAAEDAIKACRMIPNSQPLSFNNQQRIF